MLTTSDQGTLTAPDRETHEQQSEEIPRRNVLSGEELQQRAAKRLLTGPSMPPGPNGDTVPRDKRPILAVLCYERPNTPVGRFVSTLAGALARRQVRVHLFTRQGDAWDAAGVSVHALGETGDDYTPEDVEEFT